MKFFTSLIILQSNPENSNTSEKTSTNTKDLASISSQIFILKKKYSNGIDDFVEGYNTWEKTKAQIILSMAETLERLQELDEYQDNIDTISSYIRQDLRARGVSEYQLDYVNQVLPSKYKNPSQQRHNMSERNLSQQQQQQQDIKSLKLEPINVYKHQKELETMTTTEFVDECLKEEEEERHIRNIIKARKENREFVAVKLDRPLPRYKKESAEVPPEHLQGPSLLHHEVKQLSQDFLQIHRYLEDIAKSIYEFPPSKENAERNAKLVQEFRNTIVKSIKLLLVPYTDKKWSGDWPTWLDIQLTHFEQSKNYAGSKHALKTGRYAVKKDKEGNDVIFELDRGITREQVGDKNPDVYRFVQQMILSLPMIQALHDWSYKTAIIEEYDEQGNPIIHNRETDDEEEDDTVKLQQRSISGGDNSEIDD